MCRWRCARIAPEKTFTEQVSGPRSRNVEPFDVGSKDQVIVANFINKFGGAIYAKPDIKTAEDLRGKTIGVDSISDSVIGYVLRAKLGLVPNRDVKLSVQDF
jgi:ABC-type nitrate/sulfonate/bicarbonate transport system substrate-binding protein